MKTAEMTVTKRILINGGYTDEVLTMQNLVSWSALAGKCVGRGPSSGEIRYKLSWLGVLKVLLELIFVGTPDKNIKECPLVPFLNPIQARL